MISIPIFLEDYYLSDKFLLAEAAPKQAPKTYTQLRHEAEKRAAIRNEENRRKTRKQLEQEAREEGLSKSLFERAAENKPDAADNKALAMMMKMGFKPGQSLGRKDDEEEVKGKAGDEPSEGPSRSATPAAPAASTSRHIIAPIAISEWTGKSGIGTKRRAPSPSAAEMIAKMAKMTDDSKKTDFRGRARQEYLERRAYGQLKGAQRTCRNLDEKEEKKYNVLWLDPEDPETFPAGLVEALEQRTSFTMPPPRDPRRHDDIEGRLRKQMHADRLRSLHPSDDDSTATRAAEPEFDAGTLEEACQFLRLPARDRLHLVLGYMRDRYSYCLFCGTQYDDEEDMEKNCPGPSEEDHD